MPVQTLKWRDDALVLLDQTRLPEEVVYLTCRDVETVAQAIEELKLRGAPAIGITAAYGVVIGAQQALSGDGAHLAQKHQIPFYVAAPVSTLDTALPSGDQIPIEERKPEEISRGFGRQTAPAGVAVYNPAFDVTPHALVTAIITEKGIARLPFEPSLRQWVAEDSV